MFQITRINEFKRNIRSYQDNDKAIIKVRVAFSCFLEGKTLPKGYKDHQLKGKFIGYRECHILPDLLLIYKVSEKEKIITLAYLGSYSDLF